MDLKDKIIKVLCDYFQAEYVRLDDEDGISGFVVSNLFKRMSTLDRQEKIDAAFRNAELGPEERRRIVMIAGLTPEEYETVGARIRVHKVREMAGGVVEVHLHGGLSDAEYVRGTLNHQKGVQTTEPRTIDGAAGLLTSFRAKGSDTNPLTKEKAIRVLKKDQYIEVMSNA